MKTLSQMFTGPPRALSSQIEHGSSRAPAAGTTSGGRATLAGRVGVDGKFFACEARRFPFRGVTYGTFARRADGCLFPDTDRVQADFSVIAGAGFTVVRTYVEPPDDVLEAAADNGLRLLAGVFWPDWRHLAGTSRRQFRDVAREGVRAARHAARHMAGCDELLAICVGNEVPTDVVRWVGERRVADLICELVDVVHEEDDDHLVTYANYPSTEYLPLECLDFLTFNVFLERKADLRRYLTRLQHLAGDRPLVIGECGLDASGGQRGEEAQAGALEWQLETALERGVAGTCVFSWTDEWAVGGVPVDDWHFGLTRADRSARPALAVAQRWNERTAADLLAADEWPSISVVICAYNAAATLDECLRHTCELEYPRLEILVVDDGSSDDTGLIAARHPGVRLIEIAHGGLSVARNVGMRAARSEVIAYLDADAYPTREWLYYLALGFDARLVVGVGGPNVAPVTDPMATQKVARAPGGPVQVLLSDDRAEHIPGCNMAFWRSTLVEIGGFPPVYTSAGDDVDVCWKLLDRGWEIAFHPAALVWHHPRGGARTYFRQQRGYGRAEALLAAQHPDRFNRVGSARWLGRIYGTHRRPLGRQRVYRGAYGAAAYQSVYRGGGSLLDVADQVGVPVAAALVLTAPLMLVSEMLAVPSILAVLSLCALLGLNAMRVAPPRRLRRGRLRFRFHVAWLALGQPLARTWGRARATAVARRDPPPGRGRLVGPARRGRGGIVALPASAPRVEIAAAIVDVLRHARVALVPPTGWEARDARLSGSLLVTGDLVTSAYPQGMVLVRVRRGVCGRRAILLGVLVLVSGFLAPLLGAIALAVIALDVLWGLWRTGPRVRRVIVEAAES